MDDEAAKRAAAAEARRQKILARGTARLDRITLGTPLADGPSTPAPHTTGTAPAPGPLPAPEAAPQPAPHAQHGATSPSPADEAATREAPEAGAPQVAGAEGDATPAALPPPGAAARPPPEAGPAAQAQPSSVEEELEAEAALHALLNQIAATIGAQTPSQQQQQQAGLGVGVGPGLLRGPLPGGSPGAGSPRGRGEQGGGVGAAEAEAGASGRRPRAPSPGAGGGVADTGGGGSSAGATAAGAPALLVHAAGLLLGLRTIAAVERTRGVRCAVAAAAAAALHTGALQTGQLRLPTLLALLLTEAALIFGARAVASGASRLRAPKLSPEQPAAAGWVEPPPRFDWLTLLAPGLRPLLDNLTAGYCLVSGLFADVAVFLVSYLVLGAWAEVAVGRRQ